MTELVEKYRELDFILDQILGKIARCSRIIKQQSPEFNTPALEQYRQQYIDNLHDHKRVIRNQQDAIIDRIDIKDIIPVLQE